MCWASGSGFQTADCLLGGFWKGLQWHSYARQTSAGRLPFCPHLPRVSWDSWHCVRGRLRGPRQLSRGSGGGGGATDAGAILSWEGMGS